MGDKDSLNKPKNETCPECGGSGTVYDLSGGLSGAPATPCPRCSLPSPSCFIASAVYDSSHAPEVETLRKFRDNVLERSELGRKIVSLYYGGLGECVAEIIKQFPSAIPIIKTGLDYLVKRYEEHQNYKNRR